MELRQLRYFASTVRCGSLKEGARENYVTPPAVSIQLRLLEEELGEKLLVADRRGVRLTQAGETVLAGAADILRRAEGLKQALGRMQRGETGCLKMGTIDAAGIYVLPEVFRDYRQRYPGIELQVVVTDSAGLLTALQRDAIELAVVTLPITATLFTVHRLLDEQLVPVAPVNHPLAQKSSVSVQQLAAAGLITYLPRSTTRQLIDGVFNERGCTPKPLMEISSPEAMRTLCETGLGVTILPQSVVQSALNSRKLKRLYVVPKAAFVRTLGVVWKQDSLLSPAARLFLKRLEHHLGAPIVASSPH